MPVETETHSSATDGRGPGLSRDPPSTEGTMSNGNGNREQQRNDNRPPGPPAASGPPAPPRNELEARPLEASSASEYALDNRDPDFEYKAFSTNQRHPTDFIGRHLNRRIHVQGGASLPGWQVVQDDTDPALIQGRKSDSSGSPIDTALRMGTQIVCKIPKASFAKIKEADARDVEAMASDFKTKKREGAGVMTRMFESDKVSDAEAEQALRA